ncbi:MAG TPA: hypothetical protein VIM19_16775 [Actinomycetes bacterium]
MSDRCSSCTAALPAAAAVCTQCWTPVPSTGPTDQPTDFGANGFAVAPPRVVPPDPRQYSRTRAGVTSFGLVGRLVITLLALLMLGFFALNLPFGLLGIGLWVFVVLPMLMRDVWKRERIR